MSTPLFSKRHYEWLAAFARDQLSAADVAALARALASTNPRFDAAKFRTAANPNEPLRRTPYHA